MLISPNCSTPGVDVPPTTAPSFDFHAAPAHELLARFDFGGGHILPVAGDIVWRGGASYAIGGSTKVDAYDPLTRRPHNIFQRVGTSYRDALSAAHDLTLRGTLADGRPSWNATAVLRGRDGAFWITSLGTTARPGYAARIDAPDAKLPHAARVERMSDQLLAVVGGRTWQDFSGIAVDFDPAIG